MQNNPIPAPVAKDVKEHTFDTNLSVRYRQRILSCLTPDSQFFLNQHFGQTEILFAQLLSKVFDPTNAAFSVEVKVVHLRSMIEKEFGSLQKTIDSVNTVNLELSRSLYLKRDYPVFSVRQIGKLHVEFAMVTKRK